MDKFRYEKKNNDKVELTDQVNKEIRNNKDLLQKLQKTEIHLQRLTEAVEIKDRELMDLRQDMVKLKKQLFQNEQVNDLVRHYEVQDSNSQALQNELKEAKETIVKLTNEINILKQNFSQNETDTGDNINNSVMPNNEKSVVIDTSVKEINLSDFNEIESNREELREVSNTILEKEIAVKYLEEKFKRTMQDIVDLREEKQNLEHLVLQLQGETETIGEYVALYHHQRMILKQKTFEKDQQLKQLTNDREYFKSNLEKLDNLIRELVNEKNIPVSMISKPDELIKDSESFCEEHSKLHEEITKVKDEMIQNNQSSEIADKIIALLTEIKSSNVVQPKENVHHCSWCSGQLITV